MKQRSLLKCGYEIEGGWCWASLFLVIICPSRLAAVLGSAFHGNNGQPNMEFAEPFYILHANLISYGSVGDKNRMLLLVNVDIGALMANTGMDFERQQDYRFGDVLDPVSTTYEVLSFQICLPNCFAFSFWFLICGGSKLLFSTASSVCVLKAISLRSAFGFEATTL